VNVIADMLDKLASELEASKHPSRASVARQAARALREQQQTIAAQRQEIIEMARNFQDAVKVVVDHDRQTTSDNQTLAAANTELADRLMNASKNQITPEVQAAQQQIIDRSEQITPSAPPPQA
jgi:hypothetical protein